VPAFLTAEINQRKQEKLTETAQGYEAVGKSGVNIPAAFWLNFYSPNYTKQFNTLTYEKMLPSVLHTFISE
jgi:hypothetical protein